MNYDYWKACMVSFLKSMEKKTWKVVIKGWSPPKKIVENDIEIVKLEKDWTMTEDEEALGNSCTLNYIYNGVHNNIFIIVNTCTSAKEA